MKMRKGDGNVVLQDLTPKRTINSSVKITLPDNVEWLNLAWAGNIDATGHAQDNSITVNAVANNEWRLVA